jgi:acetyl-CoA synthetase
MAEHEHENVPALPVASRMKGTDGRPKPHVGPGIGDYQKLHSTTVGQNSDEFWRKVSSCHNVRQTQFD